MYIATAILLKELFPGKGGSLLYNYGELTKSILSMYLKAYIIITLYSYLLLLSYFCFFIEQENTSSRAPRPTSVASSPVRLAVPTGRAV